MLQRVVQRVVRRCGSWRARLPATAPSASAPAAAPALHALSPSLVATPVCGLWRVPPARWFSAAPPSAKKQPVVLREEDLEESFVKGSGKGGQKINKVRNCVLLKHTPTGLLVRCQKTRSLDDNRRVARKLLAQKLDDQLNGELSARNVKFSKLRKRKANKRAKSNKKYSSSPAAEVGDDESDEDDDEDFDDEEDSGDDDLDVEEHKFKAKKKSG